MRHTFATRFSGLAEKRAGMIDCVAKGAVTGPYW